MILWTAEERKILRQLSTPSKIQDFLDSLRFNFVDDNNTCMSPRMVLRHLRAQCMEGAMFAAAALQFHGHAPLVVDLIAEKNDADHVVAVYKQDGCWGALSKTNHAVLRYREPVYASVRELVMSYFHEYFLQTDGRKTLREFSRPISLSQFDRRNWQTSSEPVWYIPEYLSTVTHTKLLSQKQIRHLRLANATERHAGAIVEWHV